MKINANYLKLNESYLFSLIAKKVKEYKTNNPLKKVISLGIGDVTLPISKVVTNELCNAANDMSNANTFKGYGPEQGYDFMRNAIKEYYLTHNVTLDLDSIFISDGAKSDLGNILDILSTDNNVIIPSPVYPVYVDTNMMDNRKITFVKGCKENGFLPKPSDDLEGDIIYLCSPNNPTGAVYTKSALKEWIDFANKNDALIIYDAAYEAFIGDSDIPKSIYEIPGSKTCAIEICSLSKTAGFTGLRLGYTIVPLELIKENVSLNKLWLRRQTTKFNGVSYVIQRAAKMAFTEEGLIEVKKGINYYKRNAKLMMECLDSIGVFYTGGTNSPYVWLEIPNGMKSWDFFDYLLNEYSLVGTPGVGFGDNGEGYFRLTAFNSYENTLEAIERLKSALLKLKETRC